MLPAQSVRCSQQLAIRVRNSYNLAASGSLICDDRNISDSLLTSIVLKPDVRLLDVVSTRMLGNYGFLARVFDIFKGEQISVDVVATSEISVSVTLDCARLWTRDLIADELNRLAQRFDGFAKVKVFSVLDDLGVNVKMISQGASKTNISLIVSANQAEDAVRALHEEFFGLTGSCSASEAAMSKDVPTPTV